jgi:hypothetical protein
MHTVPLCLALYLTHKHAAHCTSLPRVVSDTQACRTLHLTVLNCIWHTGMLHISSHCLALYSICHTGMLHTHYTLLPCITSLSCIISDTQECCKMHLTALHCICTNPCFGQRLIHPFSLHSAFFLCMCIFCIHFFIADSLSLLYISIFATFSPFVFYMLYKGGPLHKILISFESINSA